MLSEKWPPNYVECLAWRQDQVINFRKNSKLLLGAKLYYAENPIEFISHWVDTYDPRNASHGTSTRLPLILFNKQKEMITFLMALLAGSSGGLVEKSRDMGATWVCCAFSIWLWLFGESPAIGWGSRKEQLVDKIGDPSSIFEKMRIILLNLPSDFLPKNFNSDNHLSYMKIINPETGAIITGEAGDNIGRGGRCTIYFKDESAYYERAHLVEAALGDNTDIQVDISSVNGITNLFYQKRKNGHIFDGTVKKEVTNVFIMDWRDHPAKTQGWYDTRKEKAKNDGTLHIFNQEIDRNYQSMVEGGIIPAAWVKSAVDAHKKLSIIPEGRRRAGFDVAAGGGDLNAYVRMHGIFVMEAIHWGSVREEHLKDFLKVEQMSVKNDVEYVYFDVIGPGSGGTSYAKSFNSNIRYLEYNSNNVVYRKNNRTFGNRLNGDMFSRRNAQDWWHLRDKFRKTHELVNGIQEHCPSEIIILMGNLPLLESLISELAQVVYSTNLKGQIVIDKKPKGTKSPNLADALVMAASPFVPFSGNF